MRTLESLISHSSIRDINSTTKRLVERCLSGDWCVQLRRVDSPGSDSSVPGFSAGSSRVDSPAMDSVASTSKNDYIPAPTPDGIRPTKSRDKGHSMKSSKSAENLRGIHTARGKSNLLRSDSYTKQANASALSLQSVSAALPSVSMPNSPNSPTTTTAKPHRASTLDDQAFSSPSSPAFPSPTYSLDQLAGATSTTKQPSMTRAHSSSCDTSFGQAVESIVAPTPIPASRTVSTSTTSGRKGSAGSTQSLEHERERQYLQQHRRSAPPTPPPKRRKPPAIPATASTRTAGGATMTTIASSRSTPSPLSRVHPIAPS